MIILHDEAKGEMGFLGTNLAILVLGENLLAILDGFSNVIVFHFFRLRDNMERRLWGLRITQRKGGWGFGMEKHW